MGIYFQLTIACMGRRRIDLFVDACRQGHYDVLCDWVISAGKAVCHDSL